MNTKYRTAGALLAAIITVTSTGCPQNQSMLEVYVLNIGNKIITGIKLDNQSTGTQDDILSTPVAKDEFQVFKAPLGPYATNSGDITVDFDDGSSQTLQMQVIDGRPLLILHLINAVGLTHGGDTFNKLSPQLLTKSE